MDTATSKKKYIRTTDGQFECPYCKAIKPRENTMHYHIKSKHTMEFAFQCSRCVGDDAPKFLQRCGYLHHLARIHPENPHISTTDLNPYAGKSYTCPMNNCNHSTHTPGNLEIHFIRNHLREYVPVYDKESKCVGCKGEFRSSGAYLYHALTCFRSVIPDNYMSMVSLIK
jgi:hypothetical protein